MGSFAEFPLLTIFVLVVLVMILASIFSPKRPPSFQNRLGAGGALDAKQRACGACGTEQPAQARYCRKCGKML